MGLFYKTMINEIKTELPSDREKIELFLKNKEEKYKQIYQLPEILFYLNICQLLKEIDLKSDYFDKKLKENQNENEDI